MPHGNDTPAQAIEGHANQQAGGDIVNDNRVIHIANPSDFTRRTPSLIADLVPLLVAQDEPVPVESTDFDISEKIQHNNLRAYRQWVEDYGAYGHIVDQVYDEYDAQRPGTKTRIMRYFRSRYQCVRAETIAAASPQLEPLAVIRSSADAILSRILNEVRVMLRDTDHGRTSLEDIEHCATIVVCHAFVECKILERPVERC